MSPSIFTNDNSRGPLYQYWRERGQEERALRAQRVQDAQLRSKGHQPLSPAFGPSSNDSYAHRATSGPPTYRGGEGPATAPAPAPASDELLPSYRAATGRAGGIKGGGGQTGSAFGSASGPASDLGTGPAPDAASGLLTSEEEKARLQQFEEQRRQIADDAGVAESMSRDEALAEDKAGTTTADGKQPERRRSTAAKIGGWFADAASGYTKKQGRW